MKNKRGITLISLIVTIIVMLILSAVVIASLSSDDNFILQALGTKKDSTEENIKEYVLSSYSQVLTNPSLEGDPIDELETMIANDNIDRNEEEQFIVKSVDKANNKIVVEYKGVEVEVDLSENSLDGRLEPSSEDVLNKKYTIAFYYKDTNDENKHTTMYLDKNQTIQQYLTASGESIPKTTEWSPALVLSEQINENRIYREKISNIKEYLVTFNLDGGNISGNTTIPSITVEDGDAAINPGMPVKTHYTFNGWNPAITTVITGDKTFTAQWIPVNYTITYNLAGGNIGGSTANQTRAVAYNTLPPDLTPIRTDYVFAGWTPNIAVATNNTTYTALWYAPMILEMKKATVNEQIVIPVEIGTGNFVLISNNGGAYVKYTTNNPILTNTVPAGEVFTIKMVGRMNRLNYYPRTTAERNQMYRIVDWGELGATSMLYSFYYCANLIGPLPSPRTNSFINVISFHQAFMNCTSLTGSIPTTLFANCPNTTSFSYTFSGCSNLTGSIPAGLFANCSNVTAFNATFFGCSNLTGSIPATLFKNCTNAVNFGATFSDCLSLTGNIPVELFTSCLKATNFYNAFNNCSHLTGIPAGLFANCPNARDFSSTFSKCTNLIGIPVGLFANCSEVTTFASTFYGCNALTGSIPATLFANCSEVTSFASTFYGCHGLTGSIPATLFANCQKVTTFHNTFADCTKLTGNIPAGLFTNCSEVTTFASTFSACSNLTGISAGLFDNCLEVTSFWFTFADCTKLTGSIPATLFANCSKVTTFQRTFFGCSNLTGSIPIGLFTNCPNVTSFILTFYNCSKLTGNAPDLWNREGASGNQCFLNCNSLNNYSSIPVGWK